VANFLNNSSKTRFSYIAHWKQPAAMDGDVEMQDADAVNEEQIQYGHGGLTEEEMKEK